MKLPVLRSSARTLALTASLLSLSALLTGCALESTAPSSVAPKISLGKISGAVHGGRQAVAGANVYVYSPSTTGYGGVNIAATGQLSTPSNASTSLLTSSVPSSCGAGGMATAAAGTITTDPLSGGLTGITVTMQGAGYTGAGGTALAPTVKITDPTGTGATAVATLNSFNGLQSIAVTTPGAGYTAPVVTIVPASTNPCSDAAGNYYVSSDANGNFSLTGDYSCTTGLPIYIYTTGGDAGGGTTGGAANFMSILGICGATTGPGVFGSSTFINVNELTTVAMAYATAGYTTDPTHIGVLFQLTAPTTLVSSLASLQNLELTGLTNAFLTASNLYASTAGNATSALQKTPNGNGTVPYKELNTLGNVLASCINSVGINNNCQTLAGYTGGATNTAASAIYIAQHPAGTSSGTVANIYSLTAGSGLAYQPTLTAAPNDWTVSIAYTGGGLLKPGSPGSLYQFPHQLNVDASGNVWAASGTGGSVLSGFSNLGVPLSATGYTNSCLLDPDVAVLDATSSNIWMGNDGTTNEYNLCEYNIASNSWTTVVPVSGTTKELAYAFDIDFDGSGNMWVAANKADLIELGPGGTFTTQYSMAPSTTTYEADVYGIAVGPGPNGNIWAGGNSTGDYVTLWSNTAGTLTLSAEPLVKQPDVFAIAIDSSNNAWVANYEEYVSKMTPAGVVSSTYTFLPSTAYYYPSFSSVGVDGSGNVWLPDSGNGMIYELSNSGTVLSPPLGFEPGAEPATFVPDNSKKPVTGFADPLDFVIDGSGNGWFSILGVAEIEEMIGVATPVTTPLAYATTNSLLGTKP
jgi:hypothetical protein